MCVHTTTTQKTSQTLTCKGDEDEENEELLFIHKNLVYYNQGQHM